ncbi:DUF4013 domain-containing protein [Halobaculum sp. CBA1158]|uniref:DUF4013 domain-containing protein n=1 Tax=Halobaculum sp. CBA1158 TaxID=2904243 RepID=UPI001F345B26|nr:DUF4013 domain-containing protein [Halobaculum sp. CBA1158]UIO98695.1 DUF4013 domain-containing protein [Halobaculum sp. CBA1158]
MLPEAIRFPLGDPADRGAAAEALAVGGGLHLLAAVSWPVVPLPLFPLVAVVGYLVRVLGVAGDASDPGRLPSFRSPAAIVRDGLVGSALVVGFLLVPTVVLVVTVAGAIGGAAGGGIDPTTPLGYGATLVGGTATLLFAVATVYPLPAVLAAYARGDPADGTVSRVRDALSPRQLRGTVSTGRYFYAWTVGATLLLLGTVLAGSGNRVASLVGFFGLFYLEVAAAAVWSRGVGGNR